MRGSDGMQEALFTFAKLEDFVPGDHPLRAIRVLVNEALTGLNGLFNCIYADTGRASIAPEKLLRAMLIQVLFSVRSERQLMEQIRYNLLFRWFIGLAIDDGVWDHSVFSKNRDRLLEHAVVERFFTEVMQLADKRQLLCQGALLGRRHADPGVGQPQELRAEGRWQRRPWRLAAGAQRAGRLEGQAAQQRHAREHDRSRCAALQEEQEHACHPGVPGTCADGEPLGAGGRRSGHARRRLRRARGGAGDARHLARSAAQDAGRRQGLRHARLRGRLPPACSDATCREQHTAPRQERRRRPHDAPPRATPSARRSASASRSTSAGARRLAASARPSTAATDGSISTSS